MNDMFLKQLSNLSEYPVVIQCFEENTSLKNKTDILLILLVDTEYLTNISTFVNAIGLNKNLLNHKNGI
jgi:hypothetical protein